MQRTRSMAAACCASLLLVLGTACAESNGKQPQAKGKPAESAEVVARIGDRTITLEEVDRAGMKLGVKPYQDLYDARMNAVNEMIAEELLDRAAAAAGLTRDELLAQELAKRSTAVSDAQIEAFYNQNKARMGGRSLDDTRGQIREYLEANSAQTAGTAYVEELRAAADVSVRLDPPRVEVVIAANDPAKGPATAAVTIVEYSDFQ